MKINMAIFAVKLYYLIWFMPQNGIVESMLLQLVDWRLFDARASAYLITWYSRRLPGDPFTNML